MAPHPRLRGRAAELQGRRGECTVLDGINTVTVPLSGPGSVSVRIDGFDGEGLVAAATVPLN